MWQRGERANAAIALARPPPACNAPLREGRLPGAAWGASEEASDWFLRRSQRTRGRPAEELGSRKPNAAGHSHGECTPPEAGGPEHGARGGKGAREARARHHRHKTVNPQLVHLLGVFALAVSALPPPPPRPFLASNEGFPSPTLALFHTFPRQAKEEKGVPKTLGAL